MGSKKGCCCFKIFYEKNNNKKEFDFLEADPDEAGLYAVEYDDDGNPTNNKILVARFTTIDKNLGPNDGLRIEWTILV